MAGKRILVGVTGGIAAYKTAELVRLLKKAGHQLQVVMTRGAEAFVTPLTFQALSGQPVRTSLLDPEAEAGMGHIELAKWAQRIIVAPASADFMARLAAGMAHDLLATVCSAAAGPIALVPAMNQAMWGNHRTQRVVQLLQADPQIRLWGPAEGQQACGDNGPGRMLEPEQIMQALAQAQSHAHADNNAGGILAGKRLVITAGPTREPIDPVRYISNHSSGKMGYALAIAAHAAGAEVVLVSGPVNLPPPDGIDLRSVITAEQMLETTMTAVDKGCDLFIATAAVADYRPQDYASDKLKKSSAEMTLALVRNPDTLATVAARADAPFTVGFAAETNDVARYALSKMRKKGLDMIVANDVSVPGLGFNSDNNAVSVFTAAGQVDLGPCSKQQIAHELVALIAPRLDAPQNNSDRKPS